MTTDFTSLNLREEVAQAITELGYTEPTPIQAAMIPIMAPQPAAQNGPLPPGAC